MTLTLQNEDHAGSWGWVWLMTLSAPLFLGAGLVEQSTHGPALTPKETYRTPLSETIPGNSGDWRQPSAQGERDWRKPKDSERHWRSTAPQTLQGPARPGHIQVLPQYQAEHEPQYDFTKENATDQVKFLEFRF